jgi:hypothetical protein
MCTARDHDVGLRMRPFMRHERLEKIKTQVGSVLKGKGGVPRSAREKGAEAHRHSLRSRMLLPSLTVLAFCLLLNQIGLFVPGVMVMRNCLLPKTPGADAGGRDDDRRHRQGRLLPGPRLYQGPRGLRAAGGAPHLHVSQL